MPRRYDLIAIDLDGTLLDPAGRVGPASAQAIARAQAQGVAVSICTGRGFNECKHYASGVGVVDPLVVAGGAIVSEARSGRTLQRFCMRPDLVSRLVECMNAHGHAALVLKDPAPLTDSGLTPGHDYLIVSPDGPGAIDPISRWWFDTHDIRYHVVPSLDADDHPELTVRVGVCGPRRETRAAAEQLRDAFGSEVTFHHFHAVVPAEAPTRAGRHADTDADEILILEAFDASVSKWSAVRWLAEHRGIDPARVAAIGNDINDIALLKHAACGVAMANAIPEALAVADRVTAANDADGVGHAIDRLLSGEW
jgi:hydroxymethylpyrimidine pyrophosphatase-like HAD family hydrolase